MNKSIDIIKGLAIISVIIQHTLSSTYLISIYRIFHFEQAVPLFMMISGYVFTLSYKGKGVVDLKSCYSLNVFRKRIKRLYIPFLVIYLIEVLFLFIAAAQDGNYKSLNISFIIKHLILGGFGPGSYYTVIMFQFLFIIPIIYIISYKKLKYSIPFFLTVGILFEFFTHMSGMIEGIYRLLIGRYIFAIALGSYLALNENKMNKVLLYIGSIISILYMYVSVYLDYTIFGHNFWLPEQAPAYFYTAFLFISGENFLSRKNGVIYTVIAKFGKASWHIFLVQMLYFWSIWSGIILPGFELQQNSSYTTIINVTVCVLAGYLFFAVENDVSNRKTPRI